MELQNEKRENGTLVTVKGRMDSTTSSTFDTHCQQIVDSDENIIVIDLTELEFISSAGLRSFLILAKKLKTTGGIIHFCGLHGMVKEIFSVSGFGNMFTFYDSADEAFDS